MVEKLSAIGYEEARAFLENTHDAVIYISKTGKILEVNKKAVDIFGGSREEIIGWHFSKLGVIPIKSMALAMKNFAYCFAGKKASINIDIKNKKGQNFFMECSATPIRKGKIISDVIVIARDVTDRKKAEELALVQRDLAIALNSAKGLDEGLKLCYEAALKASGMDCGGIYIFEESGDLKLVFHKNLTPEFFKTVSNYKANSLNVALINKGNPIYSQHHQIDVKLNPIEKREGLKAIAIIPIAHENKIIGCMNVSSHAMEEVPKYSRNALETIAAQIGSAISLLKAEEEKAKLQEKLKQYAKRLEIKVKKLEKSQIDLNEKEKLVLYSITAYPNLNDRELAQKIKLNRSTITAIKNRLRKRNLYKIKYVPNLQAIGCKLLTVIYGQLNENIEIKHFKNLPAGFIRIHSTDTSFYAFFAADDLTRFNKEVDPLIDTWTRNKIFKERPKIIYLPLELNKIQRLCNFEPLLKQTFELNFKSEITDNPDSDKTRLTRNMKEVLYALVKYPEENTAELAKRLRITKITVRNNRKLLLEKGLLQKKIIPNFKKMNFESIQSGQQCFF